MFVFFFQELQVFLEVILRSGGKTLFCIEAVLALCTHHHPLLIMLSDVVLNAGRSEVLSTPEGPPRLGP